MFTINLLMYINNQQTTSPYKNRPRCYAKSPTVQNMFWPILGLISCAGVAGKWELPVTSNQDIFIHTDENLTQTASWVLFFSFTSSAIMLVRLRISNCRFCLLYNKDRYPLSLSSHLGGFLCALARALAFVCQKIVQCVN